MAGSVVSQMDYHSQNITLIINCIPKSGLNMKGANKYICKHLFVGGSESCLSGCFRLFAQKFWEVVGLFCHSLTAG